MSIVLAVFSASEIDTTISGIQSAIRAGPPLDVKQELIKRISASWSQITGQSERHLLAGLIEIESDVTMEYGLILPHPGDATESFAANHDALDGIRAQASSPPPARDGGLRAISAGGAMAVMDGVRRCCGQARTVIGLSAPRRN